MKIKLFIFSCIFVLIGTWLWLSQKPSTLAPDQTTTWPMHWSHAPAEILELCKDAQAKLSKKVDAIASTQKDKVGWNTLLELEEALDELSVETSKLSFYSSVFPEKEQRDSAQECSKSKGKLFVDLFTREDLFRVIEAAAAKVPDQVAARILAEDYVRAFKLNGLHLPKVKRDELVKLKKQMIDLTSEYRDRLNNWSDPIWVTRSQLKGMPQSFIDGLEQKNGKFKITLDYPHYYPMMEMAQDAEIRKELDIKFMKRGGERNREILQSVLRLRLKVAKLLGYKNHAEVVLEERMAHDPKTVRNFLTTLTGQLRARAEADLRAMLEYKQSELNDPQAAEILPWDWRYYAHQVAKQKYQIDQNKLAEYFPLNRVLAGMFEIYQTLFDVRFIEIVDAPKWHPSVQVYAVTEPHSQKPRAYFYMDLHPRAGKYGHAAAFTLISGRKLNDGSYQKPVSAIVANFTAPSDSMPSLLKHDEVKTLFHEFGHIMHQVLTTAEYSSQSGSSVKRDFVEAPSQMLENWVWEKDSLAKMSGHYQTGEAIPVDMLENLLASQDANLGLIYSRQAFLAQVDQFYHTIESDAPIDTTQIWQELQKEIMLVGIPKGTYPEASFNHVIGGYDAGYYGYLWSKVFAQDMFTQFQKNGLFDSQTGKKYLQTILEPGGSKDPNDLIREFLGREPNQAAFLETLGISQGAE